MAIVIGAIGDRQRSPSATMAPLNDYATAMIVIKRKGHLGDNGDNSVNN